MPYSNAVSRQSELRRIFSETNLFASRGHRRVLALAMVRRFGKARAASGRW